jgi:tetratricopeptide (TPR) repeat protein
LAGVREVELSMAMVQPKDKFEARGEIFPWILGLITILILLPLIWQEINILRAEIYFTKSQNRNVNADVILKSLAKARDLMPAQDSYRRTLSVTALNLALIGQQQKVLTQEVKQQLLQTAVTESQLAAQLAPYNIFNWENLQQVYTVVTVPRQEDLLINNVIPQEILLDPLNPRHYNDRGWLYFNLKNDSEAAKDDFRTAIRLKPDFPDAHYNLARVYRGKGEKNLSLSEYEQTLSLLNQQISSLEAIAVNRSNLQGSVSQLKQSADQIKKEKEELQAEIEAEKIKQQEIQPPTEGIPLPPETTPPPQG